MKTKAWFALGACCALASLPAYAADGGAGPLIGQIDAAYAVRDLPGKAEESGTLVEQALKAAPNDYEVLWRAARWHCWVADGLRQGPAERREAEAKACWDLGAKAAKLEPSAVEGNYFAADGVGQWSEQVGVLKALMQGLEGIFNGYLDQAIRIDPGYEAGAPLVVKGRYWFSLPWPKRSYAKSAETYRRCLALQPQNVRAQLYLAETLLKDGKAKEAKAAIDQASAHVVGSYDPPEERRAMGWIPPLKHKIEEELR